MAARSNIVNIPTNHNRLAELIRELSQQRLAIPKLTETEPLELLLEIGIEKLLKDYEFIFSESKICKLSEMKLNENKSAGGDNLNIRKSLVASAMSANDPSDKMRKTLLHRNGTEEEKDDIEILGIRNSRFSENEANLSIAKLIQIHLTVEHLLLAQIEHCAPRLNLADYPYLPAIEVGITDARSYLSLLTPVVHHAPYTSEGTR